MKLRLRYAKVGKIRFTSHRDTARIWERAMRRAQLPVAISGGFTPRPRLSFGLALPTGAESTAEYLDVELAADDAVGSMDEIRDVLDDVLPMGFATTVVARREPGAGSLQESVTSVTWELTAPGARDVDDVAAVADTLLAATTLPIERERKAVRRVDDVRPDIVSVTAGVGLGGPVLVAEVATTGRGLRPAELASLAFPEAVPTAVRVLRTHQWIEHDDDSRPRTEVLALPVDAVTAPAVGA